MNNLDEVVKVFKKGGIVIFPTDTAFGIGCRLDNAEAVEKIFKIRERDEKKPLLALVDSIEMAQQYVNFSSEVLDFAQKYWPGGVTIILPCKKEKVPSVVRAGGETLAVRIPKHKDLLNVIENVGVPIVAPSANISGEKTPYTTSELNKIVLEQADAIMIGECTYKKESTIIDTTVTPWKIVREGAVKISIKYEYFKNRHVR